MKESTKNRNIPHKRIIHFCFLRDDPSCLSCSSSRTTQRVNRLTSLKDGFTPAFLSFDESVVFIGTSF